MLKLSGNARNDAPQSGNLGAVVINVAVGGNTLAIRGGTRGRLDPGAAGERAGSPASFADGTRAYHLPKVPGVKERLHLRPDADGKSQPAPMPGVGRRMTGDSRLALARAMTRCPC